MPGDRPRTLTPERCGRILAVAADAFHVHPNDLLGDDRHQTVALARHVAMYLFRLERLSYPEIGREMNRDHTSVMSGAKRIALFVNRGQPSWIVERVQSAEAALMLRYRIATP